MKKSLVLLLSCSFILAGCNSNVSGRFHKEKLGPDYSDLEKLAVPYTESIVKDMKVNTYGFYGSNPIVKFVNCLNSKLVIQRDTTAQINYLFDAGRRLTLCDNIYSTNVITSSSIPFAGFEVKDNEYVFYNNVGQFICNVKGDYSYHYLTKLVNKDDYSYAIFSSFYNTLPDLYFKFNDSNVEQITSLEFNPDDNVFVGTPHYNKGGGISYYYAFNSGIYTLYRYDGKILANVDITVFGFDEGYKILCLDDEVYFFQYKEYYEDQLSIGSEPRYKSIALKINTDNGKISFNDNYKYVILDAHTVSNNKSASYSMLKFAKLNKKHEISKPYYSVVLDKKLSFKNKFINDGFEGVVLSLDHQALLAWYDSGWVYKSKNKSNNLGSSDISFGKDGLVVLSTRQGYVECSQSSLASFSEQNFNIYSYISPYTVGGQRIKVTSEAKEGKYGELAKIGLTVGQSTIFANGSYIFSSVSNIVSVVNVSGSSYGGLFEITLADNTTAYLVYQLY